jgi:Esterase-like activity of phytase
MRSTLTIDTTAVPGMMELSGAAYRTPLGGSSHQLYAVQDSGNQLVTLTVGIAANGALTSAAATATQTLAPGYDFEGMALGPAGSVLVAEESTPAIRRYDEAAGAALATLGMPPVYANNRANFAFESLTRASDGSTYWTANEEALNPDGSLSTTSQGTMVRLQRFSYDAAGTLTLGPQYAYAVDPIHIGTSTDARTRSGLVDLVTRPDSTLLTLERSLGISGVLFGVPLYQYEDRIYRVTFAGATDISQSPLNSDLIGQSYTPVSKTLLWKGQVGGGFGQNMEGLALGPQLPGGDWSLLGVVDNSGGGDPLSANTLAAFSLTPSIAGDFNGNGLVDSADYVVWRKSLGTTFTQADYDVWRIHFGQSAGTGSGVNANDAVPEPATAAMLILATACWCLWRGRAVLKAPSTRQYVTLIRNRPVFESRFVDD